MAKKAPPKLPPMVYIEWIDSCGTYGWTGDLADASMCYTVGWLIEETDEQIKVVQSIDPSPGHAPWSNGISIPTVAIVKKRRIRWP